LITGGRVLDAGGVAQESLPTDGGVAIECTRTNGCVVVAGGVFKEDSKANCHIGTSGIANSANTSGMRNKLRIELVIFVFMDGFVFPGG
jgi:hypothetical protein